MSNAQAILSHLHGKQSKGIACVAVFDALKGYHQIELDEESQNLTAFMMPFDRCINLGPSFELSSASDVFTFKYRN
jgi:hypothetical protein